MGFTNTQQVQELFLSCGMGFLLGAYYDVFRILRRLLSPGAVRVFWQDVLYFVTAALMTFLFALAVTGGVLRLYLLAGLVAGFCAYRYTVGRAVVRVVTSIIAALSRFGRWLRGRIAVPVAALCAACRKYGAMQLQKIRKNMKKFKKGLETGDSGGV